MKKTILCTLIFSLLCALPALAFNRGAGFKGIGPRVGLTLNPDQIHVGGHIDFGDIADNLMMLANVEVGFGDDITLISPSFEMDYRFRSDWGAWTPYLGGGIGPIFYSVDNGGSGSDLALYLQAGIGRGSATSQSGHFFLEGKLGLVDAPDAKFTVGWTFGD
jgi:hypothetical protein